MILAVRQRLCSRIRPRGIIILLQAIYCFMSEVLGTAPLHLASVHQQVPGRSGSLRGYRSGFIFACEACYIYRLLRAGPQGRLVLPAVAIRSAGTT
jgi:hypothetical protein